MAAPTATDVAEFLGQGEDSKVLALAGAHLPLITEMAKTHTRGVGFTGSAPEAPLSAVIVSATARAVQNPNMLVSEQIGDYSARYTRFEGWSIIERSVLDNYRRKAA